MGDALHLPAAANSAVASHSRDVAGTTLTAAALITLPLVVSTLPTQGYWRFTSIGGASAFGDAHDYGGLANLHLNSPIVAVAATPTGHGYWMVSSDGGLFGFGDAHYYGGNVNPNQDFVAMAAVP